MAPTNPSRAAFHIHKDVPDMKPLVYRLLTPIFASGLILMAQSPTATGQVATAPGSAVILPGALPPIPGLTDPLAFWGSYLGLDASQQSSVRAILADQQNSADTLRANLEQARAALNTAQKANSSDLEIERRAGDLGTALGQMIAAQAKAYTRLYALLTPDQKQKFDKLSIPAGAGIRMGFGSTHSTSGLNPGAVVKQ
jgi:LTXXQ motif family protein